MGMYYVGLFEQQKIVRKKLVSNNNTDIWASQEREKSVDLKSFWRKLVAIFGEEWSWQKLASIAEQIVTATFRNSALHLFTDVGQKFQQKYWTALVIIIRDLYTLKNLIHLHSCVMIEIIQELLHSFWAAKIMNILFFEIFMIYDHSRLKFSSNCQIETVCFPAVDRATRVKTSGALTIEAASKTKSQSSKFLQKIRDEGKR